MDEMQDKAQPNYVSLAERQKSFDAKIIEQNEQIIDLLASLNKYHGDVETDTNWLEKIVIKLECIKQGQKEHWGRGKKVTIFTMLLMLVALGVDYMTKGDASSFSIIYDIVTGVK